MGLATQTRRFGKPRDRSLNNVAVCSHNVTTVNRDRILRGRVARIPSPLRLPHFLRRIDRRPTKRIAIASTNHAWKSLAPRKRNGADQRHPRPDLDPDIYSLTPKRSRYSFGFIFICWTNALRSACSSRKPVTRAISLSDRLRDSRCCRAASTRSDRTHRAGVVPKLPSN